MHFNINEYEFLTQRIFFFCHSPEAPGGLPTLFLVVVVVLLLLRVGWVGCRAVGLRARGGVGWARVWWRRFPGRVSHAELGGGGGREQRMVGV